MSESSIIIGSDHAAYNLKEKIKTYLTEQDIEIKDIGTHNEKDSVDYPNFAIKVASAISKGEYKRGILLCGTGLGMSIVANRFPNVRATICNDVFSADMSRKHNNSNILIMGSRIIETIFGGDFLAMKILKYWLTTLFEGGRHMERIEKFDNLGESGAFQNRIDKFDWTDEKVGIPYRV